MKLLCAYCGDDIKIDEEYYHFSNLDLNYHIDCRLPDEIMLKHQRFTREADPEE